MAEKIFRKPVGGVIAAELFRIRDLASPQDAKTGTGLSVKLVDDGSSYTESLSADDGQVSVQHTLTLCSDRNLAAEWFDADFLRFCAAEGVAALIELATGEQLLAGWSSRLDFEQALRLKSLTYSSGEKPADAPRVKLILTCRDTAAAVDAATLAAQ